jgi:hypothetical protein
MADMSDDSRKVSAETEVVPGGPFRKGHDPRRGRNGGRSNRLAEIQRMLDDEHRTTDNIREVFTRLKELAMEDMITAHTDEKGVEHVTRRPPSPEFMKLYLDRILGPVKALISDEDLADAPDEVIEWLRRVN